MYTCTSVYLIKLLWVGIIFPVCIIPDITFKHNITCHSVYKCAHHYDGLSVWQPLPPVGYPNLSQTVSALLDTLVPSLGHSGSTLEWLEIIDITMNIPVHVYCTSITIAIDWPCKLIHTIITQTWRPIAIDLYINKVN